MRLVASALGLATVLLPQLAGAAGTSISYLVPAYVPCASVSGVCPPTLASSFTFERALLRSPQARYTGPDKLAFIVELRGVRDAGGQLVTTDPNDPSDDFVVVIPESQVTLLEGNGSPVVGTLAPGLSGGPTTYRLDLTNGRTRTRFTTPSVAPRRAFVAESQGTPMILDSEGNRFAVIGAQAPPP